MSSLPETISAEPAALDEISQDLSTHIKGQPLAGRKILMIVENLPLPFDRRVWQEARTLHAAGAQVCIICPTGKGYEAKYELLEGIHIYRHHLSEGNSALGYLNEYARALFWETVLAWKIYFKHGFQVIQGCNPPDLIFLVALQFRLLGVKYLFDHHDINPELYEAKFDRRDFFYKLMVLFEKLTFKTASVSMATNQSYRRIAIERGGMKPEDVFVIRSGPDLSRLRLVEPAPKWKNGRRYMIGYVGVMGEQEGIDLLIDAVHYIVHDLGRSDVQFCLVGGGPSLPDLKALVTAKGLNDYITFTGRAPDQDLFEVLSTMDAAVNPDRVNPMNDKSTMNKIMEYMSFGKPMVQFDVAEGRFSAQDASLYAAANDSQDMALKLVELLDNPDLSARMGAYGRQRVKTELSWVHQVDPLISAYQRIFGR